MRLTSRPCEVQCAWLPFLPLISCFLSHAGAFWGAFLAPILLIMAFNVIAFVCIIFVLIRQVRRRSRASQTIEKKAAVGYKKIIYFMVRIGGVMGLFGLAWLFAILTAVSVSGLQETFQILFTVFNSFQGCFIFIFLCVLDPKARELWRQIYVQMKRSLIKPSDEKQTSSILESTINRTNSSHLQDTNSRWTSIHLSTYNSSVDHANGTPPSSSKLESRDS